METLKKIVKNQYFPAAAVLVAVVLFWVIAMFGGLSLLNNNQPPMATLTWLLFVYAAAVLTPLAGVVAAVNLVRRWQRNRQYARAVAEAAAADEARLPDKVALSYEGALPEKQEAAAVPTGPAAAAEPEPAPAQREQARPAPQTIPEPQTRPVVKQPAVNHRPAQTRQAKSQPLKKPAQAKQRKKAA
ncbi:MAG TPA: hypothetical protein VJ617_05920 [Arthrobacter sp.]|nr:hypothetical protein [Arthrobacter sp.]